LLHEYERIGVDAAHRELDRITESVLLARSTVRNALGITRSAKPPITLDTVVNDLLEARERGELDVDDELAANLIAGLDPAIHLIKGDLASAPTLRRVALAGGAATGPLVTLTGRGILN
ncbi:MAG TPA: hypothetical protein VFY27_01715, partial [Woeseiaceae bacterium]|nr:hypothetical protein [Woeseiaceae bacterium]